MEWIESSIIIVEHGTIHMNHILAEVQEYGFCKVIKFM